MSRVSQYKVSYMVVIYQNMTEKINVNNIKIKQKKKKKIKSMPSVYMEFFWADVQSDMGFANVKIIDIGFF